jgi:hypothetical protein
MASLVIPAAERLDACASFDFTSPNEAKPPKPLACSAAAPGAIAYGPPLPLALALCCLPLRVTAPVGLLLSASGSDASSAAFAVGSEGGAAGSAPAAQTIGYQGSALAYRTAAATTLTLAP